MTATTWLWACLAASALGVLVALIVFRTRGAASGLRTLALALVPAAGYFAVVAVWPYLDDLRDAVTRWVTEATVSPAWIAAVLGGAVVVLLLLSWILSLRGRRAAGADARTSGAAASGDTPGATPPRRGRHQVGGARPTAEKDPLADMEDIEAILKRRGLDK